MGSPDGTRKYRIKVRVVCSRPYHALFMHTMLIRPTKQQLAEFGKPEFVIYNAGAFPANSLTAGMGSKMSLDLSLEDHEMVILGTEQRSRRARISLYPSENIHSPTKLVLFLWLSVPQPSVRIRAVSLYL
jgi:phosphoenolpyruvate carboxykinase (ATP)